MDIINEIHVRYYLEKGCNLTSDSRIRNRARVVNEQGWYWEDIEDEYRVELRNKKGKLIAWANSKVSLEKALGSLSKKIKEKYNSRGTSNKPFAKLRFAVEEITDLDFFNNDNAHHLSNKATFRGWDVLRYADYCEIKVHNAANSVMTFPLYKEYANIELNLNNIVLETYTGENKAFPKLMNVVRDYLDTPLKERLAEFEKERTE